MQPANPKTVTKDYTDIYQENFMKQNPPAKVGSDAYTRMLSTSVQNNISNPRPQTPAAPTDYFTSATAIRPSLATGGGVAQTSGFRLESMEPKTPGPTIGGENLTAVVAGGGGSYSAPGTNVATPTEVPPTEVPPTEVPPTPEVTTGGAEVPVTVDTYATNLQGETQKVLDNITQRQDLIAQQFAANRDQLLQQFAQKYRISDTSGLTGGLEMQLRDYLSAAEMQQLGNLQLQYDQAIQELELEKQNASFTAQGNLNAMLAGQLENESMRTQAFNSLSSEVLSGTRTLEDAQAFADQLGLGSITESIVRQISSQVLSGAMDETTATAYLQSIGFTDEQIQIGLEYPTLIQDEEYIATPEVQTFFNSIYDIETTDFASWTGIGGISNNEKDAAATALRAIGIFANMDVTMALLDGTASVSVVEPAQGTEDYDAADGRLDDIYKVTINGEEFSMQGHQLMILAASLEEMGKPIPQLSLQAKSILNERKTTLGGKIPALWTFNNAYDAAIKIWENRE